MNRRISAWCTVLCVWSLALAGCHPSLPNHFFEADGDLAHYVAKATDLEFPDVETESIADVTEAQAPLTLDNPQPKEIWELSLEDSMRICLNNAKVLRNLGGRFTSSSAAARPQTGDAPNQLTNAPETVPTTYDPAIVETTPFTGVESSIAAFDPVVSGGFNWFQNHRPQNTKGVLGILFSPISRDEGFNYNTQITKFSAIGDQFTLRNNIVFDQNNSPTRQTVNDYNVNVEASFSHPFLQGAGAQYNRIAGPFNPFTGSGTPAFDGVVLARINADLSLADFEAGVRNTVGDLENAYWELYFAFRNLDTTKSGRASALETWKRIHSLYVAGGRGGEADKEAQAREQYFLFQTQVQTALNDLYRSENRLRYMMGLSISDGRLIRPSDEPTIAKVQFDWHEIHDEALCRSIALRRQKWRIKERELELIAARNSLQPRLDATGTYRWLGLGEAFAGDEVKPDPTLIKGSNALQSLGSGQYQEWNLGLLFSMPLGFRKEMSTVRHYQEQLARERARLQDQELEVSHEVGDALRNLEYNYDLTRSNFNRRIAAEREVEAVKVSFEAGNVTLDALLLAQQHRADAESAYYRSLVDYTRGIALVHFAKGSLLEYNGVYLAEGPWPCKAYFDADRLARERDSALYLDYGYTRPRVISRGPIDQNVQDPQGADGEGQPGPSEGPHPFQPFEAIPRDGGPLEGSPEELPIPNARRAIRTMSGAEPLESAGESAGRAISSGPIFKRSSSVLGGGEKSSIVKPKALRPEPADGASAASVLKVEERRDPTSVATDQPTPAVAPTEAAADAPEEQPLAADGRATTRRDASVHPAGALQWKTRSREAKLIEQAFGRD